jgi:hypothetical protein
MNIKGRIMKFNEYGQVIDPEFAPIRHPTLVPLRGGFRWLGSV